MQHVFLMRAFEVLGLVENVQKGNLLTAYYFLPLKEKVCSQWLKAELSCPNSVLLTTARVDRQWIPFSQLKKSILRKEF